MIIKVFTGRGDQATAMLYLWFYNFLLIPGHGMAMCAHKCLC